VSRKIPRAPLFYNQKAAEQDDPIRKYALASQYLEGVGVMNNPAQAAGVGTKKRPRQNHPQAQYQLGLLYRKAGRAVAKDPKQAAAWFQKAAEQAIPKPNSL